MRKTILEFNSADYLNFQKISNESRLTPKEKLQEIIQYYLIIREIGINSSKKC